MEIDAVELVREMERQFPKELTICVQAVQIRKLQEKLSSESNE
mgnify:CR=1 FL=1|tara:strand:+ start:7880 stop:8008 length:129 start_codon:yes stop_codon:yes gene_type:complete